MTPAIRKLALLAHVVASVGWIGAVAGFLALAIAGVASRDPQLVRAAYLAMALTGWYVIVPLSLGSLVTGVISSLGTPWGLLQHYWVLVKLLITVLASVVLVVHMQPITTMAHAAAHTALSHDELGGLRLQLVLDAGAALVVLILATTLSMYKPRGVTRYGRRKQRELRPAEQL